MKRLYLTLLIVGFIQSMAFGYTVFDTGSNAIIETEMLPQIHKSVTKTANGYKVTYKIDGVLLVADPLREGAYYPVLDGFGQIEQEKKPWLPIRNDRIAVEDSTECAVRILEDESVTFTLEITAAREPHFTSEDFVYTSENLPRVTATTSYFPADVVSLSGFESYRGTPIASVQVAPIQYSPRVKKVKLHKKLSYIVEYPDIPETDGDDDSRILVNDPFMSTLANAKAENSSRAFPVKYASPAPISYLIITHPDVQASAWEFSHTQRWKGFDVEIVAKKNWTPETIKQAVKDFYDSHQYAYYVVFFGDNNLVPSQYFTDGLNPYFKTYYSDLYYACVDGDDALPDLVYGRIPVSNNTEGYNFQRKNQKYHTVPNGNLNRTKFVGAAEFQDLIDDETRLSDGVEDRYFSRTVESVCQNVENIFDEVERIYTTSGNVTPIGWKVPSMLDFPENLKDINKWKSTGADVVNAFNSGCNIILHRDHGNNTGWEKPNFTTSYFTQLNNSVYPVVLSINCQTGNFASSYNFAKQLLGAENSGAAAVIGASQVSYSEYNDYLALSMMKSIWPEKDFYFGYRVIDGDYFSSPSLTLGEALLTGIAKMEEMIPASRPEYKLYQRKIFHCIGDPSLYIYYGADYGLEDNYTISAADQHCEITLPLNTPAYIAYWDTSLGTVGRYYGNHLEFYFHQPETVVYIYRNGMKPIYFYLDDYVRYNTLSAASISQVKFTGSSTLSVSLNNPYEESLSLIITESDNLSTIKSSELTVDSDEMSYEVSNNSNRFFFVTMKKGNETIDSKTIFKTR